MDKHLPNALKKIAPVFIGSILLFAGNAEAQKARARAAARVDTLKEVKPISPAAMPAQVPVLYGEQSKSRLSQAVGYLDGSALESHPVGVISNALTGRMAGLSTNQPTGVPRFDAPNLSLRGRNPLIIIDGIPRYNLVNNGQNLFDVLGINPEQVESVTLLKDALSTVMLGNRGMNGALVITTRKKNANNGATIDITAQTGIQTPFGMRKGLSAFDYATLYNEAAANSGLAPVFTPDQLAGYKNKTNPYLYPDVDHQNEVLRKNALVQRVNFSASGNNPNVKYFVSVDYFNQRGLFKEPKDSVEQTNVDYKRYLIRSNVELKLDQRLTANFNLMANIQDFFQPGVGYDGVFNSLINTPANASPIYNQNGTFAGTRNYPQSPYAQTVARGHLQDNLQAAALDVSLRRSMDDVLKGSWVKAVISYNPSYDQQLDRSRGFNAYDLSQNMRVSTFSTVPNTDDILQRFQQTYLEVSAGIDRTWGKNAITGLLMTNYENTQANNTLNQIYKNASGRLVYSYDERFNIEAGAAYSTNNRFAPGNQAAFYPAVGASWNLHNESFLKNSGFLNQAKIRATYGTVGNANPGYYLFRQMYVGGTAYFFGAATSTASMYEGDLVNPNRVSEKATKTNIGLDLTYSKNRGWLSFDYYNNRQFDMLIKRGNTTSVIGQTFPDENIGVSKYFGFEVSTGWSDNIGDLGYSISGNVATIGSKIISNDEPAMAYPWMTRTGNPINQIRGYVYDGLFNASNLNAATTVGFVPTAGDAKYRDLNNDGVINQYDETVIGNKKPLIYYGANLNLRYKGFDLSLLVQGEANRDILVNGNYEFPFNGANAKGQAWEYNLGRYTPATAATATLPRLILGVDNNNYIGSSLFVRSANYVRLRNAELGYSFSSKLLSAAKIKRIRVFVNGQNLATYSSYKESDPENYTGQYPLQRVVNAGLSVKL